MSDPLSVAGSIAGLVSVGDAVFRLVHRYVRSVKNAERTIKELKTELEALTGVIHNVHIIAKDLEQDQLRTSSVRLDHVNDCLTLLHRMRKNLDVVDPTDSSRTKSVFRKLTWPYRSSETRELIGEVRSVRDTLSIALSADSTYTLLKSLSLQENIEDELAAVHRILRERKEIETRVALTQERSRVLDFFFFVDPRRSFEISKELRHGTTGFWLMSEETFQGWLGGYGECLWLSGIPGAGKTILSTLVVEECIKTSDDRRAVAYYYCDYKDHSSQDPVHLLGRESSKKKSYAN